MNEIIYAGKHLITFSVSRHAHNSWEFIYCTSGSGLLSFAGGETSKNKRILLAGLGAAELRAAEEGGWKGK